MLEPTNRFMLVDALRPPDGYTLDTAVGTSFTLDLDALLLATVSFAIFDSLDNELGRPDPMALLESVRRHAGNITVFAQAGALSGPRTHPPVLAYLEDAVVPVRPPRPGHIFHPKLWAIRFAADERPPRYRLLVLSRNLTFDSSWDTIVRLDGEQHRDARQAHQVLADFIETLPGLALSKLSPGRPQQIAQLASELRDVKWEMPEGVNRLRFHPLGPGFQSPKIGGDRLLVMSPFLSHDMIKRLGSGAGEDVLISRPGALDGVGASAVGGFAQTYVIDSADELGASAALTGQDQDEEVNGELPIDIEPPRPGCELSGLHAKVFVVEDENSTTLWLGSANATDAAFSGNSEFMVELGLKDHEGSIDRLLDGTAGGPNLRSMLMPYVPQQEEPVEASELERVNRTLDRLVRDAAELAYQVMVTGDGDDYHLDISWKKGSRIAARIEAEGYRVIVGPATQAAHSATFSESGVAIGPVTLEAITSFLLIEARTRVEGTDVVSRSLVNARLIGEPADRKERLLAKVLDDPDKVLRYLLFLLAELTGDDSLLRAFGASGAGESWSFAGASAPPLLETLLRALAHTPDSLDRVAEFVTDMATSDSAGLLPAGFTDVWQVIDEARRDSDD